MFNREFPTPTAGSGRERRISDGGGQNGRRSTRRMVPCQQCGFPNDVSKIDTSGGQGESGDGAVQVTTTTESTTRPDGLTISETYGVGTVSKGGGCAMCGSKNSFRDAPQQQEAPLRRDPGR